MNNELLSAALLGTARKQPNFDGLDDPPREVAKSLHSDPAAALLEAAALQRAYQRGGAASTTATTPVPAEDDPRFLLPRAAVARLYELLSVRSAMLPEWFTVSEGHNYRAPDEMVADLLVFATRLTDHRDRILNLAGPRGHWLALQNPEWSGLLTQEAFDPSVWTHGNSLQRKQWLTQLRATEPAAAREELELTWAKENGGERADLLGVLAIQLSTDDEAFLETALDDRRKDVRHAAATLLRTLPDSAYSRRMAARARAWIRVERRMMRQRIVIELPSALDDSDRRDGIEDKATKSIGLSTSWLLQVVQATQLAVWEEWLGSPDKAVRTPMDDQWQPLIVAGWAEAAVAQQNSSWANELIAPSSIFEQKLFLALDADQRIAYLLTRASESFPMLQPTLLDGLSHPWPREVASHLIRLFSLHAARYATPAGRQRVNSPGAADYAMKLAGAHFPTDAVGHVRDAAERCADPAWAQAFHRLAHNLIQRSTMLEELQ